MGLDGATGCVAFVVDVVGALVVCSPGDFDWTAVRVVLTGDVAGVGGEVRSYGTLLVGGSCVDVADDYLSWYSVVVFYLYYEPDVGHWYGKVYRLVFCGIGVVGVRGGLGERRDSNVCLWRVLEAVIAGIE